MVAMVVMAILAAIVIPSYTSQIRKSRRTEARTALMDAAAREERFYATNNYYTVGVANLGYTAPAQGLLYVGSSYYSLTVTCTATKDPCTDFTLTATTANSQAKDTACASLTLTNTGQQSATGATNATTLCWN
jgi:type IV pilus assembly protein PilE